MGLFNFVKDAVGVVSDLGGIISGVGSFIGGKQQQDASQDMAREQMAFQERLSNSAHQREVADLKAAGLNPILSTRHGGASSPSGSMGTAVDYIGNAARSGASSAMAAKRLDAELDVMRADEAQKRATAAREIEAAKNVSMDTALKQENILNAVEQRGLIKSQTSKTDVDRFVSEAQISNLMAHTDLTREQIKNVVAHTQLNYQQIRKLAVDMNLSYSQMMKIAMEIPNINASTANLGSMNRILDEQFHSAKASGDRGKALSKFYGSQWGQFMTLLGLHGKELNPFGSSANSAADLFRR